MKLQDCSKGDFVRVDYGSRGWYREYGDIAKIVSNNPGGGFLIELEYKNGETGRFSPTCDCIRVSF